MNQGEGIKSGYGSESRCYISGGGVSRVTHCLDSVERGRSYGRIGGVIYSTAFGKPFLIKPVNSVISIVTINVSMGGKTL